MNLIVGSPGSGKTKVMLELSQQNNIPILCESQERKERLLVKSEGYGITIPVPIVFNELTSDTKEVYVDDIARLMASAFGVKLNTLSVNIDEEITNLD